MKGLVANKQSGHSGLMHNLLASCATIFDGRTIILNVLIQKWRGDRSITEVN